MARRILPQCHLLDGPLRPSAGSIDDNDEHQVPRFVGVLDYSADFCQGVFSLSHPHRQVRHMPNVGSCRELSSSVALTPRKLTALLRSNEIKRRSDRKM
ncbi:hypothetical protein FA13DRAFT_1106618 [Coprinellus micaceus]|uniref:Uncharacterized protein n=1 Tax=Coprinellus micaceus TaxID=71717 RepID=A0A4Y7RL62_COPMI|nr:hypothetical protein FA13DRAFT_1106618 [Coprinellus micaceus]